VEDTASVAEALAVAQKHGHSRIPVYHESIDDITGVVYAKDLLIALNRGDHGPLSQLAREAYFVPESKKVDELLREMQVRQRHLAVVIDEYGAAAGLVTIEDLLEEIVGPIMDEYDVEESPLQMTGEGIAEGDARASVDELSDLFDVQLPEGDFDSVGGLIVDRLGRLPEEGDRVECNGLALTVLKVAQHRIQRVRIERLPEPPEEEAEGNNDRAR
jgi:CBS domain containing-hemolysin-like protein